MIKKEDIERAITLFKEWDFQHTWKTPSPAFIAHTKHKSENALKTAQYILKIMEDQEMRHLFNAEDYNGTLWIINSSYYRILFLGQYLLALDGKKLPDHTEDSHKTTQLAIMYYFIIKGSGLESKKNLCWEDIKESRFSKVLELMVEAEEEAQELTQQKAKRVVEYFDEERTKRHEFTYAMLVDAELSKARTSIDRAIKFGDLIKEFIRIKKWAT